MWSAACRSPLPTITISFPCTTAPYASSPCTHISIIPPWEGESERVTDKWSQIFVGRTRDLLFTPVQPSTSCSSVSSAHELRPHNNHHHRWTRAESLLSHNRGPFTATIKPSGHMALMTLTQSPFSSLKASTTSMRPLNLALFHGHCSTN